MKWFLKGTVVGAVSAAVILAATAALAGSGVGGIFNIGVTNSVNRQSALVGKATGAMLRVRNNGSGPAASFQVAAGKAPFAVNSNVKVGNLNADMLDGVDSSGFYAAGSKVVDSVHADNATNAGHAGNADHAADAAKLGGIPASEYLQGHSVAYLASSGDWAATILELGDLTLQAQCRSNDDLHLYATTTSDHAWLRVSGQGDSDLNVGERLDINVGSDSGVLVFHTHTFQIVTLEWASWENGIGYDCQFWGTAVLTQA